MTGIIPIVLLLVTAGTPSLPLPQGGGWRDTTVVLPDSAALLVALPWLVNYPLTVTNRSDTLSPTLDYNWDDSLRALRIQSSEILLPGDSILIRYQSAQVGDRTIFFKRQPYTLSPDSLRPAPEPAIQPQSPDSRQSRNGSGLRHSGALTRGIRFGTGDAGGVTSGLHLDLSGNPSPGVTVSALIDDRNIPATSGGGSATLAELDRLMMRVSSEHFKAEVGDFDLNWERGRYSRITRRLKGVNAAVDFPSLHSEITASGDDHRYRSLTFFGRDGDQGPYELTDRYDRPGVSVVAGSETVALNGQRLTRGRGGDYLIDYQRGEITFNPSRPIRSDSRFEVDYEYAENSYPRSFYAVNIATSGESSPNALRLSFSAVREAMNGDNPSAFDWNDALRASASAAGDRSAEAVVPGIDSVGYNKGDYVWEIAGVDTVLAFSPPDSLGRPTGYLQAYFSADTAGRYDRVYDSSLQTFYYRWVGSGLGGWSPKRSIPLPDRADLLSASLNYSQGPLQISGEAAVTNYDRNTMSARDDNDNTGAAYDLDGQWKPYQNDRLKLRATLRRQDRRFHPLARAEDADHRYRWNIMTGDVGAESVAETVVEYQPLQIVRLNAEVGYLEHPDVQISRRGALRGQLNNENWDVRGAYDRVFSSPASGGSDAKRLLLEGALIRRLKWAEPSYQYRSERSETGDSSMSGTGSGYWEHELGGLVKAGNRSTAKLGLNYRHDDRIMGKARLLFSDTRTITVGFQGIGYRWGSCNSEIMRRNISFADTASPALHSTSASLESRISPPGGIWSLRLDYYLSTGNNRAGAQVAVFVGEGSGGWRRESGRFVADPQGDWQLSEALTDTIRRSSRVDFKGELTVRPQPHPAANDQTDVHPLGITRSTTRLETALNTVADDPVNAFLLDPRALRTPEATFARMNIVEDLFFLENAPGGDGRLTLRRDETRDRALAGGESLLDQSIAFRIRLRLNRGLRVEAEPQWRNYLRRTLQYDQTRADVTGVGANGEMVLAQPDRRLEPRLGAGWERRRDAVSSQTVTEFRVLPGMVWYLAGAGTARLDMEWRNLRASAPSVGYDLDQGWEAGNNWTLSGSLDYRLGAAVTATVSYRSVWRGRRLPEHTGLVEFTARL